MKPLTVTYDRLHSFGSYNNERYSVTVEIEDDETAEDAFVGMRELVKDQICIADQERREVYETDAMKDRLSYKKQDLERVIAELESRSAKLRDFLLKNGVEPKQLDEIDLPF